MKTPYLRSLTFLTLLLTGLAMTGCRNIGPETVTNDRFDYSSSIAESWKQQTLLNIVKLRYMDLPVFVDVSSVVAGYSLETSVNAGASFPETTSFGGNTATLGGSGRFTDRPTITYVPMTGEKFLRGLVTPIDPKNIFFMIQAGYRADFILGLTVNSLNGIRNNTINASGAMESDPEFPRILQLISEIQQAGAVNIQVVEDKELGQTAIMLFRNENVAPGIAAKSVEVRRLLNMPPEESRFVLTYAPMPSETNQLAVSSRSMLQILTTFSGYIEVPEEHLRLNWTTPAFADISTKGLPGGRVRIKSGTRKPEDAFAAVQYRDHWFWIDNGDLLTKRALTSVVFFFTLAETGGGERLPLITIPAQ